jgi:UDP-2,3-diacylglucosamine pyrophosphatase LpxH
MLCILSDLHFSDASVSHNVHPTAFTEVLFPDLAETARSKNASEINLILLGDIFDFVLTDFWTCVVPAAERPWNGTLDPDTAMNMQPAVEGRFLSVLDRIIANESTAAFLDSIAGLRKNAGGIDVTVTFVTGNHDRAIENYPSLKSRIRDAVDSSVELRFAQSFVAEEYAVAARHGHEWDEQCHAFDLYTKVLRPKSKVTRFDPAVYRVQTIGEVITAELMAGLVWRVRDSGVAGEAIAGRIMDAHLIRPMTDVFSWLEWYGRNELTGRQKQILLRSLRESIQSVLDTSLARLWDDVTAEIFLFRGDITDRLQQLLRYIKGKTFNDLKRDVSLFGFFNGMFGGSKDDFTEGAKEEFQQGRLPAGVQYVVYGHTHEARSEYFSGTPDGTVRMYVNTGTFLPLIERARHQGFARTHQMSMAYFYRADEDAERKSDGRPSMEFWCGKKRKEYGGTLTPAPLPFRERGSKGTA